MSGQPLSQLKRDGGSTTSLSSIPEPLICTEKFLLSKDGGQRVVVKEQSGRGETAEQIKAKDSKGGGIAAVGKEPPQFPLASLGER